MQLAYLEDDTPTREEFDHLEKRVDKLEQKTPSNHYRLHKEDIDIKPRSR